MSTRLDIPMSGLLYQRVLLKLSGEILGGELHLGIDRTSLDVVCGEIKEVADLGVQLGIVVGGGNILRGAGQSGAAYERTRADRMGMLATLINSLALEDGLEALGVEARVLSSVPMVPLTEAFSVERARELLKHGVVAIFGGGTGHPFFSTDTAAALRALEIGAQVLLKGTKVDGVYDRDPMLFPDARRFERLSHREAVRRELRIMDLTALSLCLEHRLPIQVFNLLEGGSARRVLRGEPLGTLVAAEAD